MNDIIKTSLGVGGGIVAGAIGNALLKKSKIVPGMNGPKRSKKRKSTSKKKRKTSRKR